jgi:hypothetical protein
VKVFAVIPVLLVVLVSLCGSPVPPPATPTIAPTPTATPGNSPTPRRGIIIANTFDDAVHLNKPIFNIHGSTLHMAHVDTASYVETTVGQARAMFEPTRPYDPGDWGVPESSLVWVIVAYGQFQPVALAITPTSGVLPTAWAAVVEGGIGAENGYSDQHYDLSQLGTPHDLDPAVLNSPD